MSYRPTIAVYINGRIADLGYYKNWSDRSLFYEAAAIYALYHDCNSVQEYRSRKFGAQKTSYILEPEIIDNTEENLKWLESCSEFPVVVDLTNRCLYMNEGSLTAAELMRLPSASETWDKLTGCFDPDNFYLIMQHCRIPLDKADPKELLRIMKEAEDIPISKRNYLKIQASV